MSSGAGGASLRPGHSGHDLYSLVEAYDALGLHRTGTPTDEATRSWVAEMLAPDLDVTSEPYTFDRFDSQTRLVADGAAVDHHAHFYEAVGAHREVEPAIVGVDTISNWIAPDLPARIASARTGGATALVVATTGTDGRLVAFNRSIEIGSGLPVVLVAERDLGRLRAATQVRLDYSATITPTTSANVVARGGEDGPQVLVTTPLTGWFTCAGERGPGIALAVNLAARLAEHARVTFLATTGHELHYIGARRWLNGPGADYQPDGVVHLGASMATGPAVGSFTGELVHSHLPAPATASIGDVYAGGEQTFVGEPEQWVSEAKEWISRTNHLLSYSGLFPLFHTPDDRLPSSVTAERLDAAARRLDAAAAVMVGSIAPKDR